MSLRDLAAQRLALIDETARETSAKQVKQPDSCFVAGGPRFSPVKHAQAPKTAISDACFTVSFPKGETHETSPTQFRALRQWRAGLATLDPLKSKGGIAAARWERLVRDAVDLFNGWAPQAVALGWSELDLFGVDPKLRPDHQVVHGLAWRLDCWRVHSLSENMACLVGKFGGSPGRYYRGDCPRLVPLWGLQ